MGEERVVVKAQERLPNRPWLSERIVRNKTYPARGSTEASLGYGSLWQPL